MQKQILLAVEIKLKWLFCDPSNHKASVSKQCPIIRRWWHGLDQAPNIWMKGTSNFHESHSHFTCFCCIATSPALPLTTSWRSSLWPLNWRRKYLILGFRWFHRICWYKSKVGCYTITDLLGGLWRAVRKESTRHSVIWLATFHVRSNGRRSYGNS